MPRQGRSDVSTEQASTLFNGDEASLQVYSVSFPYAFHLFDASVN